LYSQKEIHFEEIYADILDRAYLPPHRGPADSCRKGLLESLHKAMEGNVVIKGEEFFLKDRQGNLEFTLLAEGMRKLGLLWILIQNGTLVKNSVLFWDEPEANLNPSMYGGLIDILLKLQRMNVQVFLATHDYLILKELDLRKEPKDKIVFHSLYRDDNCKIRWFPATTYTDIHPNAIAEAFAKVYDLEVKRSLGDRKP